MAYSEKYFHRYCDIHGNEFRVSLRVWDYSGSAAEVECGQQQFVIERENSSDLKLGGVFGSRATATFVSDAGFDLEELFTGDELTYLLVRLKNGNLDWQGNVIPDGFTQGNWDEERPMLTVRASDNLSTLKGKTFTDEVGDNYGDEDGEYMQSFLWVIKEALKKTGFNMPIWTMVDLKTQSSEPLSTYSIRSSATDDDFFWLSVGTNYSTANEIQSKLINAGEFQIESASVSGTFSVTSAVIMPWFSGSPITIRVYVSESVPAYDEEESSITIKDVETGLVLSRRGHFNDVAPSEVGIYKRATNTPGEEVVDFSFLQIGDTVKISQSQAGNNGTYTVTGFVNSVPPDSPYIRIQLNPQVPVQVHENIIIEIISQQNNYPDPLTTIHNIRTWIQDSNIEGKTYFEARGGAMMTWDVLDAIARQFGTIIQQNNGHWEVKRWNADKIDNGRYQWFVYNSEGTLIGREDFGGDTVLTCVPTNTTYRIFGSTMSMDRVLKYAIVNYRYKYKQEGDNLQNLVVNGDFEGDLNPYPLGWNKVHVDNVSSIPPMVIGKETSDLPAGYSGALTIQNYADTRTLDNLTELSNTAVNSGDVLYISWWEKVEGATRDFSSVFSIAVYEYLEDAFNSSKPTTPGRNPRPPRGDMHSLVLSGINSPREGGRNIMKGRWQKREQSTGNTHFRFQAIYTARPGFGYGLWRKVTVQADAVPVNGFVKVEVLGVANLSWSGGNNIKRVPVFKPESGSNNFVQGYIGMVNPSDGMTLITTGIVVSKLLDPDNNVIPQIDPFMYPDFQAQIDRHYSDTIPEIEVLTGDDYGDYAEDRISGMWWNGERTTMWDTWDNRYGWSRQGLVTAKSVMEMYWKPTRLLDCEISAPGIHWSSRIQFEELPGKRFVILRGSIGGSRSTFRGTLTEIYDDADTPLPPGGDDGGNTVDPNWQPAGVNRCVRDRDTGLNTGEVESVEVDANPASPTYGQERWVNSGTDTDLCPIGQPIDFYWGASTLSIDPNTLEYFPYVKGGDNYTMQFTNDGTGKYLVFLWRRSLGAVQSILDVELEETISSWVVESDVMINGYTYGVMRMSYMTGVFTGLDKTFKIQ